MARVIPDPDARGELFSAYLDGQLTPDEVVVVSDLLDGHCTKEYHVTVDGNEQFARAEEFIAFLEALKSHAKLEKLLAATLAIEQPLERKIALDPARAIGIREICQFKHARQLSFYGSCPNSASVYSKNRAPKLKKAKTKAAECRRPKIFLVKCT